ncbi:endonuclease NucS domain-containing protein [Pseudomonas chlororaphis]|uniref:endonuclease NucS domain-containing protein n=1 Tax=Pseudomonas chlororaphis TaxID=587753 RepID=UPI001E3693A2|nr:endonuclease NucS domain-containing protein [Pseudomonas chlororaphis]
MNRLEDRIKNYLAGNLSLIEDGLTLVKKEFPLGNADGADGVIDILARDGFGHYVVIEIKRSDQVARAALHELTKYTALLKSTMGVRPENIRALLLSTAWHELGVPFTEYCRVCEVPTQGYILYANEDGVVSDVKSFVPVELSEPLTISRQQGIFFLF